MSTTYIKSLDGFRGIAVLLVILYHFSKLPFISFDFEIGWIGVQMFFVLSGYLITRILINEKKLTFSFYLKRFYWRRALRIIPIYFAYILSISIIYAFFKLPEDLPFAAPYLFTYTYNFSIFSPDWEANRLFIHLWSLSIEEQFYLVWPFLVFFTSIKSLRNISIALIICIPIFRFITGLIIAEDFQTVEQTGNVIYWFTFSHFDAFAIGGLMSIFSAEEQSVLIKKYWIILIVTIVAGSINLFFFDNGISSLEISSLGFMIHRIQNLEHVWGLSLLNVFSAMTIIYLVKHGSAILSNKGLVYIGKVSYGMYLYHFVVIMTIDLMFGKPIINEFITLLICLTAIILISTASYYLFEKKFLLLKKKRFTF